MMTKQQRQEQRHELREIEKLERKVSKELEREQERDLYLLIKKENNKMTKHKIRLDKNEYIKRLEIKARLEYLRGEIEILSKYEAEMLDLIYGMEDLPTSDLQGCIGSILLRVYRERK